MKFESKSRESAIKYPKVSFRDVFAEYWKAIREYPISGFVVIFAVILSETTQIFVPIFYKRFFDLLATAGSRNLIARNLFEIIFFIFLLNIINWLGYRASSFFGAYSQAKVMAKLRQNAFDYMIGHSYTFFSNNFTGSLVQRVNRFVRAYERLDDRVKWNILPLMVRIIGVFIVLYQLKAKIAYILAFGVLTFLAFNFFFSRWKLKYDIRMAEMDSATTGTLSDALSNQNTIQLFTGTRSESENFKKVVDEQGRATLFAWNLSGIVDTVQVFIMVIIEFTLFYFAIRYWRDGLLSIGGFVMIQVYLISLGGRLWDFSRIIRDLYEGMADAKEMVQIMKLPHEIQDIPGAKEVQISKGKIEFKNIVFGFNQSRNVLNDISVTIESGEKVALIGPSGAGKSTFVRLLLRFYNTKSGAILIDGQNSEEVTHESLLRNISLVPQDPILFHRTLMENIRYGKQGATDEEVIRVAKLAHCDEFVKDLPKKYETYVGERGIKLSGGERQRVAIARAILKNAPILILDEATSSLDSHSEVLIQDALDQLMKGKTTIVIAHRLSTIRKMDRIIVIDKGQITEQGTHDELLLNDASLYKKLWNLQAGGFLFEESEGEANEKNEIPLAEVNS